ncbi:DUF3472 domain-containing protein [Chryseobacterium polytrichastri]|uniref:Por secretion system C-terminal sorting domain-containing protein n=1 Tax=Chryseobacterium polytrichastri TaxID=1302687 RepID=A0A1M6XWY1_9FLAO|nr:RICIN domain-containing protein [Chryseobacterium polytrichastri]SHL10363.1 Por secretion system C-terminal sorting domain-containing protein [Chryseobacterium polytrichastri]
MKSKFNTLFLLLFLAVSSLQTMKAQTASCPSWGPYLEGFDMANSGELWYSEAMADNTCKKVNTYYSTLNFSLGPRGGYAGIQYKPNEIYNNIFSMWDLQDSNVPQCTTEYVAPNTYVDGFGGEGTGLHTDNPMPWTPGTWYATVVRRWSTGDGKTRIGFFMYNYGTQKWKHYVTIITPENDAKFTGTKLGSFVENWNATASKATRCGYFRNFWSMNAQGNWSKPARYTAAAGTGSWGAETAFNNTAIKVTSCGTTPAPVGSSVTFNSITQDGTKPSTALPITVTTVTPSYNAGNNSMNVSWASSETTSPQLSYKVSLYTEASWGSGYTPVAVVTGIRPDQRSASVPLPANSQPGKYYVSVVLEDIFKQTSNFGYNSLMVSNIVQPVTVDPNAFYRIKCVGSGQYITPANYSSAVNTKMVQQPLNSNLEQQWKLEKTGNNYIIINRASGLAIDVPASNVTNGTSLVQYSKHGGNNQQWVLRPYTSNTIVIGTALSNMKAMDNPANSQTAGTNINIWDQDMNGAAGVNHQWVLEAVSGNAMKETTNVLTENNQLSTVYPNPVKQGENLYINLPEQDSYELKIVNIEGLTINSQNVRGGKASVSTSGLRSGVYFYNAKSTTQTISGKFTVQ